MKLKKLTALLLVAFMVCSLFSGCSGGNTEVGRWHAVCEITDIDEDLMSSEELMMLSMLAGTVLFEVDLEFKANGEFTYDINTDALEEALTDTYSSLLGFMMDEDVSDIASDFIEGAFEMYPNDFPMNYEGVYEMDEDGFITIPDQPQFIFAFEDGEIYQLDDEGDIFLAYYRN